MGGKIRVLIAKPGLDGHDRGAKVVARALRDAGMEVIYTGLRQSPEDIVSAAIQEDVQFIGLSILSGAHGHIFPRVPGRRQAGASSGPLVFVEKTEPVGYGELVQIAMPDGTTKRGQVLDTSKDIVVVQVFEGTTGIDRASGVKFLGH